MTLHAEVRSMREWWSADARQAFTEVAQEMEAFGVKPEDALRWLARLYAAAAADEAEGGDGVRVEAVSLRRLDLQTQVGNTEDGEAIMETVPTLQVRVRRRHEWKELLARPLSEVASADKFAQLWDAEGLNG